MALRVLSAILFYPRGGSAQVARALARGLREHDCAVTLVAGSRHGLGDARRFYADVAVHAVDFDAALASSAPLRFAGPPGTAPIHPSFEDRPGAPDAVFASLDDLDFERQVTAWTRELARAGACGADVAHLHHLTPLNEAMARAAPEVPVVGQLHGTELLMLERIAEGAPEGWRHAERWAERLRTWARRCRRLVVTPTGEERAARLLGVPRSAFVSLPSGVDTATFAPRTIDRRAFWHEVLVEHPEGWWPGTEAGSLGYAADAVAGLEGAVVLLCVGRFTAVKRIDRLLAAFGRARARARTPAALVLVGGHPGEWEGEHPALAAQRLGVEGVFLAGWRAHDALPDFFAAADAIVTTSEREHFGLVLVEAMACGLPALATRSPGPELIVRDGETGWLVDGEDGEALTSALAELIDRRDERRRRGEAATAQVRARFGWDGVSATLARTLAEVASERHRVGVAGA